MESQISQLAVSKYNKSNDKSKQKSFFVKRKSRSKSSEIKNNPSSRNLDINNKKTIEKAEYRLLSVIRISGVVKVRKEINDTLNRLRLRRKYSCIIIPSTKSLLGMIEKVKYFIAYGEIDKQTLEKLIKARGKSIDGNKKKIKINESEVADGLFKSKKLTDFGLKPFFRLHPPRKGIKSKIQYPRGVLGHNNEINKLIEKML